MFEIWMTLVGISMGFSSIPQIVKICKRKSSGDISITLWIIIFHGLIWWFIYGIYIKSPSLTIANGCGIVIDTVLLFLILKYRKN